MESNASKLMMAVGVVMASVSCYKIYQSLNNDKKEIKTPVEVKEVYTEFIRRIVQEL